MFKRTGDIAGEAGSGLAERQQTAADEKGVFISTVRTGDHDSAASHKVTEYVCPRRAERRHLSRRRVQLREDQENILAEQLSLQRDRIQSRGLGFKIICEVRGNRGEGMSMIQLFRERREGQHVDWLTPILPDPG